MLKKRFPDCLQEMLKLQGKRRHIRATPLKSPARNDSAGRRDTTCAGLTCDDTDHACAIISMQIWQSHFSA